MIFFLSEDMGKPLFCSILFNKSFFFAFFLFACFVHFVSYVSYWMTSHLTSLYRLVYMTRVLYFLFFFLLWEALESDLSDWFPRKSQMLIISFSPLGWLDSPEQNFIFLCKHLGRQMGKEKWLCQQLICTIHNFLPFPAHYTSLPSAVLDPPV